MNSKEHVQDDEELYRNVGGNAENALERASEQLVTHATELYRPRAEAALAQARKSLQKIRKNRSTGL